MLRFSYPVQRKNCIMYLSSYLLEHIWRCITELHYTKVCLSKKLFLVQGNLLMFFLFHSARDNRGALEGM